MTIEADEQGRIEKHAKIAWWLTMCSGMGISLIIFFIVLAAQADEPGYGFLVFFVAFFTIPGLLIMNLVAFFKGFMGRRTDTGKRALHRLGLFWANMIACVTVSVFIAWLRH